ncbi:MAG: Fic family protein [Ilumatobacteraceae bacterium]
MTTLGQFDLPPMPPLDAERLERHGTADRRLAARIAAVDESTRRAFVYVQHRILVEAAASIEPSRPGHEPEVLPIRRRYIGPSQSERRDGVARALRHVDERVTMARRGLTGGVLLPETPMVLHAFVEGSDPQGRHTNAGMVRVTPNSFAEGDIPFTPPPPEHCRRLLEEAIQLTIQAPAPTLTRAMWLLATVFAVHPFVDGNGRTGRLLMHAVLAADSATGTDWGTIPEFAAFRRQYLEATRVPLRPSLPSYDARKMEPIHLMRWTADAATRGIERVLDRLDHIDGLTQRAVANYGPIAGLVVVAVIADRNARLAELTHLVPDPDLTHAVNELIASGILRWDRWGGLQSDVTMP